MPKFVPVMFAVLVCGLVMQEVVSAQVSTLQAAQLSGDRVAATEVPYALSVLANVLIRIGLLVGAWGGLAVGSRHGADAPRNQAAWILFGGGCVLVAVVMGTSFSVAT